jgi:hypothetical protein
MACSVRVPIRTRPPPGLQSVTVWLLAGPRRQQHRHILWRLPWPEGNPEGQPGRFKS